MKSSDILNGFEKVVVDGRRYNINQMSLEELKELKADIHKRKQESIKECSKALDKLETKDDIEEDEVN